MSWFSILNFLINFVWILETEELVSPRKSAKKSENSKKSPPAKAKVAPKGFVFFQCRICMLLRSLFVHNLARSRPKSGRKNIEESKEKIDVMDGVHQYAISKWISSISLFSYYFQLETFNASIKRADDSCRQEMMDLYAVNCKLPIFFRI